MSGIGNQDTKLKREPFSNVGYDWIITCRWEMGDR